MKLQKDTCNIVEKEMDLLGLSNQTTAAAYLIKLGHEMLEFLRKGKLEYSDPFGETYKVKLILPDPDKSSKEKSTDD